MISVYLRPDKTQILKARMKKNHLLEVKLHTEIQSYWNIFSEKNIESAILLFDEVKKLTAVAYEDLYIVLPDFIFKLVDCFDYNIEEDIYQKINEVAGTSIDNLYISMPLDTKPSNPAKRTVYAIEKTYIDILIEASEAANITLTSVEAASMSLVRSLAKWSLDQPILELFDEQATIVNYSPVGGIFRTEVSNLAKNNLEDRSIEEADREIERAYAQNNYVVSQTFRAMRTDANYIVLTEYRPILKTIKNNLPVQVPQFPNFILSDLMLEEQMHWMINAGTFLQDYKRDEFLFDDAPAFLEIKTANLLPQEAQAHARKRQWQQISTKICRGLIGFLMLSEIAIILLLLCFNAVEISPQIQAEYDKALSEKPSVEKEIELIAAAEELDQKTLEGFLLLLKAKPESCGFTSVNIGTTDLKIDKIKKQNKWIQLDVVSKDQMVFQDFQSALMEHQEFSGVIINSIHSDSNKIQTANITIGRSVKEK